MRTYGAGGPGNSGKWPNARPPTFSQSAMFTPSWTAALPRTLRRSWSGVGSDGASSDGTTLCLLREGTCITCMLGRGTPQTSRHAAVSNLAQNRYPTYHYHRGENLRRDPPSPAHLRPTTTSWGRSSSGGASLWDGGAAGLGDGSRQS